MTGLTTFAFVLFLIGAFWLGVGVATFRCVLKHSRAKLWRDLS